MRKCYFCIMTERLRQLIKSHYFVFAVLIVTFLAYSFSLSFSYISWDDPEMVFKNRDVINADLKALVSNHYVGNYIPVTMILHALAWFFFGDATWGHHLLNLIIHLLNGWLVYRLSKQIFKSESVANFTALVFLLHPLQVESVVWISELKNLVSATFYLSAISVYVLYFEKNLKKHYFISLLLFLLGCLSKSSVVILPLILILIEWYLAGRFSFKMFYTKIPFLAFSILFGIINLNTQAADLFINHSHEFPYYQRLALAAFALLKYLILFVLPINLSVVYPYPEVKSVVLITGFLVLAVIVFLLTFLLRRKKRSGLFVLLFFIINFLLVLQLVPFGEVLYADRYSYISLIAFGLVFGLIIKRLNISTSISATVLMVVFSLLTFSRTVKWKNSLTLYEDILKNYPGQFLALNSAGVECMFLNEDKKALKYFDEAVKAAPNNYKGFYNRGLLMIKNNEPQRAIASFNQAISLYEYSKAYVGRATAYYMTGDLPKAINDANYVISKDDKNVKANYVIGNCYNNMNNFEEALKYYNKCIELDASGAEYYFKRSIVYGKQQDFKSAIGDLNVCLQLQPDFYEAYYWRGVALVNLNQNPCQDFVIAARQNIEPAVKAYNKYCNQNP